MELLADPERFRETMSSARAAGQVVGLVPTMGALHDGHLALVARARQRCDLVAVSIFVNPTQFGPGEDLDRYPRTLDADRARCDAAGVDVIFAPSAGAMYPPGDETRVRTLRASTALCGVTRPEHFEGVCTVVTKLLVLAGRCVAVFGRKDYQQWRVVDRLVRDLLLPVEVVGVPTVREPDGLALSSRNAYLSADERRRALSIARSLSHAVGAYAAGERAVSELRALVERRVAAEATSVDYVEIADADTVTPLASEARLEGPALLAVAARFGSTRLIDNVVLGSDPAPIAVGA